MPSLYGVAAPANQRLGDTGHFAKCGAWFIVGDSYDRVNEIRRMR